MQEYLRRLKKATLESKQHVSMGPEGNKCYLRAKQTQISQQEAVLRADKYQESGAWRV